MMYTNSYDILETTSYIILYISQKVNHILETAHMSSKPEKLLIYCDTHTFNICNRLTVAVFIVNNA